MYDFRLDSCGNVRKINYNNAIRDSFMSLPVSELQSFYGALSLFETMLNDRKYCIRQRLQAGASVWQVSARPTAAEQLPIRM